MKKIAILTSGGDAPGMNAAIRAATRTAIANKVEVFGIERGYRGLIENRLQKMKSTDVSDIVQRGGTILQSARCLEFPTPEGTARAVSTLKEKGIEGLVVIGGDGSFRGAERLTQCGIPCIGIPGTIDNDLAYTDFTLGFDTACNTVLDSINRLRDTMSSHSRVAIVKVMGRDCGDIALYSGIGGGAEIILVPEVKPDIKKLYKTLEKGYQKGKKSMIIVMAEGVGSSHQLAINIRENTSHDVKITVLGHIQRGGSPTMQDRFLGTSFGSLAVNCLMNGKSGRVVGIKNNEIFDMDIFEALKIKKPFNKELFEMACVVSK
ncbi:MAG: 6-phosphofructokinase [Firmicutes bacterium]|nr:6-phosphofructokinase [Bacillota bacterium]